MYDQILLFCFCHKLIRLSFTTRTSTNVHDGGLWDDGVAHVNKFAWIIILWMQNVGQIILEGDRHYPVKLLKQTNEPWSEMSKLTAADFARLSCTIYSIPLLVFASALLTTDASMVAQASFCYLSSAPWLACFVTVMQSPALTKDELGAGPNTIYMSKRYATFFEIH